jgi:SAM-dependent methyltransferase
MSNIAWDKFYNDHGRFYLLPHPSIPEFIEKLKSIGARKVLDLGCGSGRHMIALAEKGFEIEGIDFSPAAVRIANESLENHNLPATAIIGDIHEKLAMFKTAEFDAVLAVNSLNYQESDHLLKSIKEINRVLKTGGIALIVLPSQEALIINPGIEQIFVNEKSISVALEGRLQILHKYLDEDKNFVIIAQETKNT